MPVFHAHYIVISLGSMPQREIAESEGLTLLLGWPKSLFSFFCTMVLVVLSCL